MDKELRFHGEYTANNCWIANTYINLNALGVITVEDRLDLGLHVKNITPTHHTTPASHPYTDAEFLDCVAECDYPHYRSY